MLLMNKDVPVMQIDVNEGIYESFRPELLPFQLRNRFRDMPAITGEDPKREAAQYARALLVNGQQFTDWLASRVLPLTRKNAKKIYQLFGYEQLQDAPSKARIATICRAVSLQDDFWIKLEDDKATWDDVNLRKAHLSEIVAQVSLHGSSLTLDGKGDEIKTPELNGQGAYAKAWIREPDGLYLHKRGGNEDNIESHIEVCVSNILDKCNVEHVRYLDGMSNGRYTCKCRCMTTESLSMLPGMDFIGYMNVLGANANGELFKVDRESIYKMFIVDYLVSNRDRHGMNWGMFYDSNNMKVIGCHPLYDHNNAFDEELMQDKDAEYLFDKNMTMKGAAITAMKHVDFHFTDSITKEDFMNVDQYNSFKDRAEDLGIEIDKGNDLDRLLSTLEEACRNYMAIKEAQVALPESLDDQIHSIKEQSKARNGAFETIRKLYEEHPSHRKQMTARVMNVVPEIYPTLEKSGMSLEYLLGKTQECEEQATRDAEHTK